MLIVPDTSNIDPNDPSIVNSESSGQKFPTEKLEQILPGKTLGDEHNNDTFDRKDLPDDHRVLEQGDFSTMDFKQDRVNVHLDEEGKVEKVTRG